MLLLVKTHTVRIIESNSAVSRAYTERSKSGALRLARALVKGCIKGEGRVFVYEGDQTHADGASFSGSDPIKTFRA